jgi:two-component system, LytTR family, response regulator
VRVVLVDDEALANRRLEILLRDEGDVEVVASALSGRQGVEAIEEFRPNVVFLDVEMPGMDGFEAIESLKIRDIPIFVFVTAHADFAIKAFEREAIDYLMKPVERERLSVCLDKVRQRMTQNGQVEDHRRIMNILHAHREADGARIWDEVSETISQQGNSRETLTFSSGDKVVEVRFSNIDWIEAERDYLRIYYGQHNALVRGTMAEMADRLQGQSFQRVHRSAIVNINRAVAKKRTGNGAMVIVLQDGTEVRVGRKYSAEVNRIFGPTGR